MSEPDVVVIGGGVMGVATARALAVSGASVVVLERAHLGHVDGSSHGNARIWRTAYADPSYVRMMFEALPLWRALEDEVGEQLLGVTGALWKGAASQAVADGMLAGGSAVRWMSPDEVRALWPSVSCETDTLFDEIAGVVRADRAWRALAESAIHHGARIVEGVEGRLGLSMGQPVVEAGGDSYRPGVAVVTAGAWARDLLGAIGIGLPVRPTRETVGYWRCPTPVPVLIDGDGPTVYALPTPDGLIKAGEHVAGPEIAPGADGEPPDGASLARVQAWLERLLGPGLALVSAETCLYTNAPDDAFILERHGDVVVGSPCSGHGFKFAPLIGARLAAMALGGPATP